MKKIISLVLIAVLLLSVFPIVVSAEENTNPIKIVDAEGNDVATYAALQDAYDAVQEGQKIVITEDITLAKYLVVKTYDKDNLRNIVIEGAAKQDGTKVKVTAPLGLTDQLGLYNLTVRNLEIIDTSVGVYGVFMYDPYYGGWLADFASPTLVIDNCVITSKSEIFKFKADSNQGGVHNPFIVKIKDSTLTSEGAADRGLGTCTWKGGASVDMTIEGSTLMLTAGNQNSNNPEFSYIFTHYPINGGATTTSFFNLNVDGNSKLINNSTNTATPTAGIFYGATGVSNITLEEGAELYVNSGANKTQNSFFRGSVNLTDNGAIYKVSATTAKNGITLPTFGDDVWYVDGDQVTNPYVNASATGDVVLTHGAYVPPSVDPIKIVDAEGNEVATYTDLQAAFDAATDGQKIILLDDYILNAPLNYNGAYNASDLKDVVIEGANGATLTCANGLATKVGCYNLTLKNLDIVNSGTADVLKYMPGVADFVSSTTIVDNCTINAPMSAVFNLGAEVGGNTLNKHNPFIVKIKDSTVSGGGSAATSVICVPWNTFASVELSIENSTVMAVGGNATSPNPETSYVFCFNPIKSAVTDLSSTCNVTVDGTSKLIANFTGTVTPTGGIFNNIGGTATITLAEGAELYVNNGAEKTQSKFILNTRGTTTINDNGAIWKVGANAAKNGVTLPTFGEHVWYVGDTPVANPYVNASATGDVVLTHDELANPDEDPNNVAYVMVGGEKVYYSSVRTALSSAPDGSTIVLLRDSSYTGHGTFTSKSLTIEGNGFTLTTSGGYTFDVCGSANNTFTIRNLKVNSARFMYNEFSTIYIENCTINDSYGLVFSIALPDGVDANINIKDTTINLNTTNNEPFARTGNSGSKNCDVTFNIQNSDINMTTSKAADGGDNGRSCFNMLTAGTVTVNLDGTSSLVMNGQYMRSMFMGHDATGGLALNLAEGAKLAINNCAANAPFITANMSGKTTIVDNGADWIIGEAAAANGVVLPVFGDADETVIGYAKDGKIYKALTTVAGTYKASDFTNVVGFTAEDFAMIEGASLRTVWNENGIRFSTTYTDALKAAVGNNAIFGTVIAPTKLLGENELTIATEGALNIASTKSVDGDGITTYHAAVIMNNAGTAEKDIYTLELAARGYMTITYADETTATFYAEANDNVRDMYTTAKNLVEMGETNAVVEHIISVCEA
ncbi:MAG: hypothetical protein E7607_07560 [Ruminococcaceae bacterium]|nr:hypothetical protein [Oscillospiraceae bacterium]